MLTSGSAASIGIDPDVFVINLHVEILFDIGHDIAGYKGGLAFACSVKGRNPDKTMYAFFGGVGSIGGSGLGGTGPSESFT